MAGDGTRMSGGIAQTPLPQYAQVVRGLPPGMHRYLDLLPGIAASPAMARVAPDPQARARLIESARTASVTTPSKSSSYGADAEVRPSCGASGGVTLTTTRPGSAATY